MIKVFKEGTSFVTVNIDGLSFTLTAEQAAELSLELEDVLHEQLADDCESLIEKAMKAYGS